MIPVPWRVRSELAAGDPSPRFNAPTISSPIEADTAPLDESLGPKTQSTTVPGARTSGQNNATAEFSSYRSNVQSPTFARHSNRPV